MRVFLILIAVVCASGSLCAIFTGATPHIVEVPVDRILDNLERPAVRLSPVERLRAVGRVHLLAYLRGVVTLPVYRNRPEEVAEGPIGDCQQIAQWTREETYGITSLSYQHERLRDDLWVSRTGATLADQRSVPTYDWTVRANLTRTTH